MQRSDRDIHTHGPHSERSTASYRWASKRWSSGSWTCSSRKGPRFSSPATYGPMPWRPRRKLPSAVGTVNRLRHWLSYRLRGEPPAARRWDSSSGAPASTLLVCATRPLSDIRASDAALDVLANTLGRGPASRLGATLRDRNGLTYWTSARVVRRRHARAFVAFPPLRADQADVGVRLFRDVLEQMREAPPTAQEMQRAKAVPLAELDAAYDDVLGTSQEGIRARRRREPYRRTRSDSCTGCWRGAEGSPARGGDRPGGGGGPGGGPVGGYR